MQTFLDPDASSSLQLDCRQVLSDMSLHEGNSSQPTDLVPRVISPQCCLSCRVLMEILSASHRSYRKTNLGCLFVSGYKVALPV